MVKLINLLLLLIVFCSCSSIKKNSSFLKQSTDSTSVSSSQNQVEKYSDNTVEKYMGQDSVETNEEFVNIEFIPTNNDTSRPQPITIKKAFGVTTIDIGDRKVKSISQKTTNTSSKKKETKEKTNAIQDEKKINNKANGTSLKKDVKTIVTTKQSFRFNWWLLLLLVPIYFVLKKFKIVK